MKSTRSVIMLAAVAGLGLAAMSGIADAAPSAKYIGTWSMDLSKAPAGGPKSITLTTTDAGGGKWKSGVDTVAADGTKSHNEVTYAVDGKAYPVTGDPTIDSDTFTSPDANTLVIAEKKGGKLVDTLTSVLSADGKTQTATVVGTGADGKPTKTVDVWVRQ